MPPPTTPPGLEIMRAPATIEDVAPLSELFDSMPHTRICPSGLREPADLLGLGRRLRTQ